VKWVVEAADEFKPEFDALGQDVRRELLALARVLQEFGPQLGRPRVDTLNGSRHANMKELRFSAAGGEWRVAFAFDPTRKAILLVAGLARALETQSDGVYLRNISAGLEQDVFQAPGVFNLYPPNSASAI